MSDERPKPRPHPYPHPSTLPGNLPAAPDDDHDTAEAWADYAADLFRARADWRMVRTAASVSQALAYVEAVEHA